MKTKVLILLPLIFSIIGLLLTKVELCIGNMQCVMYDDWGQLLFVWGFVIFLSVISITLVSLKKIIFWGTFTLVYVIFSFILWLVTGRSGSAIGAPDREGILFVTASVYVFVSVYITLMSYIDRKRFK